MRMRRLLVLVAAVMLSAVALPTAALAAPQTHSGPGDSGLVSFRLDRDTRGVTEKVSNIYNTVVVASDRNVFRAEYEAGFVQGRLQGEERMLAARDDNWDGSYLTEPAHTYPRQIPPTADELAQARLVLLANWDYTLDYIAGTRDRTVARNLQRLMYRLIGVYDGATRGRPRRLPFSASWRPRFTPAELLLSYETPALSFLDLYSLNTWSDVTYLLPYKKGAAAPPAPAAASRCSAFTLRTAADVFMGHATFTSFLSHTEALSVCVAGDLLTCNTYGPGLILSVMDFGYSNKGLLFNETTLHYTSNQPQVEALWSLWRAGIAEHYATSIEEFFRFIALEASGTYMSGYTVVDTRSREIGYVEMSYDTFVFFRLRKGGVTVTTRPAGLSTAYDTEMIRPNSVMGINYPVSLLVREQLGSIDVWPARRPQFLAGLPGVRDIASAKALITYTDPANPMSIYGRRDLGYGVTPIPKKVPSGAVDAKVITATMTRPARSIRGILDTQAHTRAFWMKFGSAYVDGTPFIWSQSPWAGQKLRLVPDRIDGEWRLLNLYMR